MKKSSSSRPARSSSLPPLPPRPEARTVVLSMKIKPSMAKALEQAAKVNERSKASIAEAVIEQWLKAEGFLK